MNLILGSSSKYRLELLKQAGLNPQVLKPNVDEALVKNKFKDQEPLFIALQLASLKSFDILQGHSLKPPFLIIGSDQVCVFNGSIFDKPGAFEKNFDQLKQFNGKTHSLLTAVCLLFQKELSGQIHKVEYYDETFLTMKDLSDKDIENYIKADQPYDCAGGYKYESLGKDLFSEIKSKDLTSIQGLPMKQTLSHLKEFGVL
jgi:septum formation protein